MPVYDTERVQNVKLELRFYEEVDLIFCGGHAGLWRVAGGVRPTDLAGLGAEEVSVFLRAVREPVVTVPALVDAGVLDSRVIKMLVDEVCVVRIHAHTVNIEAATGHHAVREEHPTRMACSDIL